jgi:hypothetical protein
MSVNRKVSRNARSTLMLQLHHLFEVSVRFLELDQTPQVVTDP